jgi:hypothetical protein
MHRRHIALLASTAFLFSQPRASSAHPHADLVPTLVLPLVSQAPDVDGLPGAPAWVTAPWIVVDAVAGEKPIPVTVSACATADAWYVRCRWADGSADAPPPTAEKGADAGTKPVSDSITITCGDGVKVGGAGAELQSPREADTLAFDASKGSTADAQAVWKSGWWTAEFRRHCKGPTGAPPGAMRIAISDPARGLATASPVRMQHGAAARRQDFEWGDSVDAAPKGFRTTLAGKGKPASWFVRLDGAAGSNRSLVQEAQDEENDRFPLALLEGTTANDVDLSVRFQARKGFKDRAAGLVWRVKDEKNHYILRANALEANVVLYKMQDGLRIDLPPVDHPSDYGVDVKFDPAAWHVLRVTAVGDRFSAYLDGVLLFDVVDTTFTEAGGVGLWTKSDSVIAFDDLVVVPLDAPPTK